MMPVAHQSIVRDTTGTNCAPAVPVADGFLTWTQPARTARTFPPEIAEPYTWHVTKTYVEISRLTA
jgi:hypothetical protein